MPRETAQDPASQDESPTSPSEENETPVPPSEEQKVTVPPSEEQEVTVPPSEEQEANVPPILKHLHVDGADCVDSVPPKTQDLPEEDSVDYDRYDLTNVSRMISTYAWGIFIRPLVLEQYFSKKNPTISHFLGIQTNFKFMQIGYGNGTNFN